MSLLATILFTLVVVNIVLMFANAHLLLRQKRHLREVDQFIAERDRRMDEWKAVIDDWNSRHIYASAFDDPQRQRPLH